LLYLFLLIWASRENKLHQALNNNRINRYAIQIEQGMHCLYQLCTTLLRLTVNISKHFTFLNENGFTTTWLKSQDNAFELRLALK